MRFHVLKFLMVLFLFALLVACNSETSDTADSEDSTDTTETEQSDEATEEDEESEEEGSGNIDGEIRVAYSAQPPVLDSHINTADAISDTMRHVFDTLVTIDENYNVQPSLADSWEISDDGKTYTFHLRQGVLFHNGKEFTAEDAAASMNRWKDSRGGRGIFTDATFEAIDDYTLELRLPEPLSITLAALSYSSGGFAAIYPKEVVDNASPDGITEFIGTGPFKFVEWKPDQYIHLTRFEEYKPREEPTNGLAGRKEALAKDLIFEFVADPQTREAGIRSGEYDFAHAIPFDSAEQLEATGEIVNYTYPGAFLILHFNKKKGLFTDVKARQGVAAALEMESILKAGYSNEKYYILNHNMMMSHQHGQWYSDVGKEYYNQNDPEKAKQLLEEAGYKGEELTLLTTRDYIDQYHGAVVVQEQLEQLGMKINLEVYDWPTLTDKIYDEDAYDMYMMANIVVSEPTSSVFFNKDYAGWPDDPYMEELVKEFRRKSTIEEAMPIYDQLQEWIWTYVPAVKIGDYNRVSSARTTLENFQYLDGMIFWNVKNNK